MFGTPTASPLRTDTVSSARLGSSPNGPHAASLQTWKDPPLSLVLNAGPEGSWVPYAHTFDPGVEREQRSSPATALDRTDPGRNKTCAHMFHHINKADSGRWLQTHSEPKSNWLCSVHEKSRGSWLPVLFPGTQGPIWITYNMGTSLWDVFLDPDPEKIKSLLTMTSCDGL